MSAWLLLEPACRPAARRAALSGVALLSGECTLECTRVEVALAYLREPSDFAPDERIVHLAPAVTRGKVKLGIGAKESSAMRSARRQ